MKKPLSEGITLDQIRDRKILLKSEIGSLEERIAQTLRETSARLNPFTPSRTPQLPPAAKALIAFETLMEGIALCRKIRSLFRHGPSF